MRFKILEGTPNQQGPSLCLTCRSATIVRGTRLGDEVIDCSRLAGRDARVTFQVSSCSGYTDRRHPSLYDMEDIAWILRSDPKKNEMGFVKANESLRHRRFMFEDND